MKVSFDEFEDNIIFRISDFDAKYEDVLKMCFYQPEGKSYFKSFPRSTKHIEKIKENYSMYAEEMFSQLGYFKPILWEKALLEFVKRLEGTNIDWWLTGSCAACIRGIPLNPHDVDIMISSEDVEKLSEIFVDCIIEPIMDTEGWVTKDFGVIFLHARIDIASDPQGCLDEPEPADCGPYAKANLEKVMWKGYEIKVPPLHLQLNVNKRRGRFDRAELIQGHIDTMGKKALTET
jgi:hypothetical protein